MKQLNKRKTIVGTLLLASTLMCSSAYAVTSLQTDVSGKYYTGMIIDPGVTGNVRTATISDFRPTNDAATTDEQSISVAQQSENDRFATVIVGSVGLAVNNSTNTYKVGGNQYQLLFIARKDSIAGKIGNEVSATSVKKSDFTATIYASSVDLSTTNTATRTILKSTEFGRLGLDVANYDTQTDSQADQNAFVLDEALVPASTTTSSVVVNSGFSVVTQKTFEAAEKVIKTNTGNIATNRTDIDTNTGNIATNAGNIATNAAAIDDLRAEDKNLKAGVAMSVALSSNIYLPSNKKNAFGLSIGQYDGESAIAAQIVHRVSKDIVLNFGAANSNSNTAYRAGGSFAW